MQTFGSQPDRRRHPRAPTRGLLVAEFAHCSARLHVPDFSERGCAVAVDACLPTGATRVVTFVAPHQVRATLTIIVVECRRLDAGKFRLHCRFLGDDRSIADRAKLLLDAVRRQRPSLVAARSAGSGAA